MNKIFLLFSIFTVVACTHEPAPHLEQDLKIVTPTQWDQTNFATTSVEQAWWHAFNDPLLNHYIEILLAKNTDIATAALKVRSAQIAAGLTNTNLTPDVSASAAGAWQKNFRSATTQGNVSNPQTNPNPSYSEQNQQTSKYSSSLTLSYELDLWGKLADARTASRFEAEATAEDWQATRLSLIGTTATLYWKACYLNQLLQINQKSLAYSKQALSIAQAKYRAGNIDSLDVLQAEQNVATQQATLEATQQNADENRYAFAILFDQAPETVMTLPTHWSSHELPQVPTAVPVSLLSQRPDVKAAELRVRKEFSTGKYTEKSYYPTFSLTSALSTSSDSLKNILKSPTGSLGSGLSLPFLEWQERRLTIDQQRVAYQKAVLSFRQTLYTALSEVETALSARSHTINQGRFYQLAFDKAQDAETISATRYRNGSIDMQSWLEQQETTRTIEKYVLENWYNQLKAQLSLYQAFGGGAKELK